MHQKKPEIQNLLFLASIGLMACDDDSDRGTTSIDPTGSGMSTTSGAGTGQADDDERDDSGTGPGETTDEGVTWDDGSDDAATWDDGWREDDGAGPLCEDCEACDAYGEKFAECFPELADDADLYAQYCQEEIEYYSYANPWCAVATEEWYACLASLSCRELTSESACRWVDRSDCNGG